MACVACHRQALSEFVRALSGLSLNPALGIAPSIRPRRQLNTTGTRRHRPSRPTHFALALPSESAAADETFVPFENASLPGRSWDTKQPQQTLTFSPPPPSSIPAHTGAEATGPSIQLVNGVLEAGESEKSRKSRKSRSLPLDGKGLNPRRRPRESDSAPPKARQRASGVKPKAAPLQSATVEKAPWQTYKAGLKKKFGDEHWMPHKKVSPDAREGIRALHAQYPDRFTTPVLAKHFQISPDAIRRILKSKWRATAAEEEDRRQRWDKRGERIWTGLVEKGFHPPKRWRSMGIGGGPRRPAQDRRLRHLRSGSQPAGLNLEAPESKASWLRSLSQRVG